MSKTKRKNKKNFDSPKQGYYSSFKKNHNKKINKELKQEQEEDFNEYLNTNQRIRYVPL